MYTQLSAVADGILMLAWITLESRPYKQVEDSLSSAQFFGNRVLKEQKDKYGRLEKLAAQSLTLYQGSKAGRMDSGILSDISRSC